MTDETVKAILHACEGKALADRRDAAMIRLLLDSGARRSEIAALMVDAVDPREKIATVVGKGRRPRIITFGSRTALAIDRYLRERRLHRDAERPELWLGHRGPVTSDGIAPILEHRCAKAGLSRIGAHAFRHLFAHAMLSSGMQETDLMRLAGWRSRQGSRRQVPGTPAGAPATLQPRAVMRAGRPLARGRGCRA